MKILVLCGAPQQHLSKAIERAGHTADYINPKELNLYISDAAAGYDAIYRENLRVFKHEYDCVISRIGNNREYATKLIEHFQHNLGVFCTQSGEAINTVADKFKTSQILSQNHIRTPKQFYASNPQNLSFIVEKLGGLPLILKELSGSKGKGIILLESPLQTNMTLQSYYGSDRKIILQQFIDASGKDERHIVVNGKVVSSIERQAPETDIRANLSLEGTGKKIIPDNETKDLCIKAVAAIPGLNFAGVDVMRDKEGKAYVIEINSNPGELICEITGYNHFNDLVKYCEENYKKGGKIVNENKVTYPMGDPVPGLPSKYKEETFNDWAGRCTQLGYDVENITKRTWLSSFYRKVHDELGSCYKYGI